MSALDAVLAREGALLRGQAPVPERFGSPWAEQRAIEQQAAILDERRHAVWSVEGSDRERALHGLLSMELRGMKAGELREGLLLTPRGKLVGALALLAEEDRYLALCDGGCAAVTRAALERYLRVTKARLAPSGLEGLGLVGPRAPEVLGRASGMKPEPGSFGRAGHVLASPHDFGGLPAYRVLAPAEELPALWTRLRESGAQPAGIAAWETVRVSQGVPAWGSELTGDVFPQEVGLEPMISYAKGCFVGQEVVARIHNLGHVNRALARLAIEATKAPPAGAAVVHHGAEAGRVTSSAAPPGKAAVALAFLRREAAVLGARVEVGEQRLPAVITRVAGS